MRVLLVSRHVALLLRSRTLDEEFVCSLRSESNRNNPSVESDREVVSMVRSEGTFIERQTVSVEVHEGGLQVLQRDFVL